MQRFIVERISDGAFLELDLPVEVASASQALSGPGSFSGAVKGDAGGLRMASGELLADQRKSFLHEEVDGVIRNTWLVTRCGFTDEWRLEGRGFSSYLDGYPYEGEYRGVNVDMADVIRHIWSYVQRLPASNLGVTVKGMTGVRKGTDSDIKADQAQAVVDTAQSKLDVAAGKRKAKEHEIKLKGYLLTLSIKRNESLQRHPARLYRDKSREKRDDQELKTRKATLETREAAKKADPAIVAYKAKSKQKSDDADLRTRYRAYEDVRDLPGSKEAIKAAKEHYDARRNYWDAQLKPLKRPNEDRTKFHDGQIAIAKREHDDRLKFWDDQLKTLKVPVDQYQALITAAKEEREILLEPLQDELEVLREAEEPFKEALDAAKEALDAAKKKQSEDGGAWKILWPDTPDCGTEVQRALDEAGWEFVEWSGWNADRSKILKEIRLMERVGRQQNELRFVEGENIIEPAEIESNDSVYANTVIAIGAGEGDENLRVTVGVSDGRVRTPFVVDAKDVTRRSVLEQVARAELAYRSRPFVVAAIRVDADHPNARRGSFGVGDSILVDCEVSWLGRQQLWHRIIEMEWIDESTCDLFLEAS